MRIPLTYTIVALNLVLASSFSICVTASEIDKAELTTQIFKLQQEIASLGELLLDLREQQSNPTLCLASKSETLLEDICRAEEDLSAAKTILEGYLDDYRKLRCARNDLSVDSSKEPQNIFKVTFTQAKTKGGRSLESLLKEANQNSLLPVEYIDQNNNLCQLKFSKPNLSPQRVETIPKPSFMKPQ